MKAHTLKSQKKDKKDDKKVLTVKGVFGIIYKRQPRGRRKEKQIKKTLKKDEKKL